MAEQMVVKYKPSADFNGTEYFRYQVSDSLNTSNAATVTFDVFPVDDKPSCIANISPADAEVNIDYADITLTWDAANDKDNDSIANMVYYGKTPSTLQHVYTPSNRLSLPALEAGTSYYWYVEVQAAGVIVRCPSDDQEYHTFTTINHSATISGFSDVAATINDSVTFNVNASAPEKIREYQWAIDGDANSPYIIDHSGLRFKTT